MLVIVLTLFALASICNAVMDILIHKHSQSVFAKAPVHSYWGTKSWVMKYARDAQGEFTEAPDNWYYKRFNIKYKESFPLSATALVFITDGWHLMQFGMWFFITLAIIIALGVSWNVAIPLFLILTIIRSVVFEWFYSGVLIK